METPWFRALRNREFFGSQESAFYETKALCGDKVVMLRKQLAAVLVIFAALTYIDNKHNQKCLQSRFLLREHHR